MRILKPFIKGFISGQRKFGENIAVIVNSFLLTIVYFVGVGLTSLVAKAMKKRFLEMKTDKNAKTYWTDLNLRKKPREEYYRQF